jgi:hypothetical protein
MLIAAGRMISPVVGGEVLQIDKLAVLAPQLLIAVIVLVPLAILLYKKPWILSRMLMRLFT